MRRALELAERGLRLGRGRPRPLVGAVLVKGGRVLAEAGYERPGGPHAEAQALARAGGTARGATLYVTLEPCVAFPGKRTPPCADAIVKAGVARVVVATRDPNPRVEGRGLARLREAGVEVVELPPDDPLRKQAERLNDAYAKGVRTGEPFVALKYAMTLDGKVATRTGEARWISSEEARRYAHALRARYGAVLVGVNTVLRDDPQLTVRLVEGPDPVRVVLDSRGRVPLNARVLHVRSDAPTVVATCAMPPERELQLKSLRTPAPLEVWRLPPDARGRVELQALLQRLKARGIDGVLVEGGPTVAASFVEGGLVDKVVAVVAPKLVGGREAPSPVAGRGVAQVREALPLKEVEVRRLGPDVVIEGYLRYPWAD